MSYFKWWIAGGNNQVGANSHVVEHIYKDKDGNEKTYCFIQELGLSFADRHKPDDPDYFFPDITDHLIKYDEPDAPKKSLAQAIVVTHGHLDHIGAIAVLAKKGYKLPKIYGTRRSISLIQGMLKALDVKIDLKFRFIDPDDEKSCKIKMNECLNITWYPVSHSVSGSGGFVYESQDSEDNKAVRICFQIDFKTDTTVLVEPGYKRSIIQEMGRMPFSTCFMESTRATEPGKNSTEMQVMDNIQRIIHKYPKNRIVATTMASNDQRLAIFIYLAHKNNRQFIYFGRAMEEAVRVMKEEICEAIRKRFNEKIDIDQTILNGKEANLEEIPASEQLIMLTGTQAEVGAAMTLASKEEHKKFTFKENDIVIDSASIIPGSEDFVFPMIKKISGSVEKVYMPPSTDVHASGHGLGGELAEFLGDISKTDLKSFVTIHGEPKHRAGSKKLGEKVNADLEHYGHKPFNIIMPMNGDILKIDINGAKIIGKDNKDFLTYTVPEEDRY